MFKSAQGLCLDNIGSQQSISSYCNCWFDFIDHWFFPTHTNSQNFFVIFTNMKQIFLWEKLFCENVGITKDLTLILWITVDCFLFYKSKLILDKPNHIFQVNAFAVGKSQQHQNSGGTFWQSRIKANCPIGCLMFCGKCLPQPSTWWIWSANWRFLPVHYVSTLRSFSSAIRLYQMVTQSKMELLIPDKS